MILGTQIYIITLFFSIVVGVFVLISDRKNKVNKLFGLLIFFLGLWILSNILVNLNTNFAIFFARSAIIWVALLPITFNRLIKYLYFADNKTYQIQEKIIFNISLVIIFFIILLSQTDLNIVNLTNHEWGIDYQPGFLYIILLIYLLMTFGFSFIYLHKISIDIKNLRNKQAKFILYGTFMTLVLSLFTNIIFPLLGYGFFNIFGPPTVLIFLTSIAYSITRHHLFNIKVIAVEIIMFVLWILILSRTILAHTIIEKILGFSLLSVAIVVGTIIIRSVLHNIYQRVQINKLSTEINTTYYNVIENMTKISK